MTVTHWIERGARWLAGFIVAEMTKPLLRGAWALAKGWLRNFWTIFLKGKATMLKQTLDQTFEGSIGILRLAPATYDVTFAPYFGAGALQAHRCRSDAELRGYLELIVAVKDKIAPVFASLREREAARIDNVLLTDDQVLRHGLDSTPLRQIRGS